MANNAGDDVALLKEELAQFLLGEITSAQGGQAFRGEVSGQVSAVVDQILADRLKPTLDRLERQAAEQAQRIDAALNDALSKLNAAAPAEDAQGLERRLADVTATLEQLRQRLGRVEDQAKPRSAATAQPIALPAQPRLADERIAAPRPSGSPLPRWLLWLVLLLIALTVLGLGNLYYERLFKPEAITPPPQVSAAPLPAETLPPAATPPPTPQQQAPVSVPPQNPPAIPPVTPTPVPTPPMTPAVQPAPRFPADFAIERGWLAAQPFAIDPLLAHRVGSSQAHPTLKSLVCGNAPNCASDTLMTEGMAGKQLIALQMLMSQIGDRFCTPRRSVAVTGLVSAAGLADLAAVANCAGGAPIRCHETQNKVCPPDADALQSGSQAARSVLLRWALWKMGST